MLPIGFWGMTIEVGKTYTQTVDTTYQITMAALTENAKAGQRATLYVRYEHSEDSESDEENSEDADVSEYALCTLVAGRTDQQQLNLTFVVDEKVTFFTRGDARMCLSGSHLIDEDDQSDEMDGDMQEMYGSDSGEEMSELEDSENDEEMSPETLATFRKALEDLSNGVNDDDEMHSDDSMDEPMSDEIDEALMEKLIAVKRKAEKAEKAEASKKPKIVEIVQKVEKKAPAAVEKKAPAVVEKKADVEKQLTKKEKKAAAQAAASPVTKVSPAKIAAPVVAEVSNKKTLPSGLIIEDEIVGKGPQARNGKKVSVRYIGTLATTGKKFDSNVSGPPFTFRLGAKEVIRGWDSGVEGMHVGGTRKLTIPAALAYGAKGAKPDIPSNATLIFEVKLLDVK